MVLVITVFLDSNADCNGPVRELYGQTARVIGHGAVQVQQGPRSCTLTLRSSSNYDKTNLYLEIVAATIRDPDVRLTIYDGLPTQGVLVRNCFVIIDYSYAYILPLFFPKLLVMYTLSLNV